jgi:hypothetical protein
MIVNERDSHKILRKERKREEKRKDNRELTRIKQKEIRGNGKRKRFTSINKQSIGVELLLVNSRRKLFFSFTHIKLLIDCKKIKMHAILMIKN